MSAIYGAEQCIDGKKDALDTKGNEGILYVYMTENIHCLTVVLSYTYIYIYIYLLQKTTNGNSCLVSL
jgi:hypothetical protein